MFQDRVRSEAIKFMSENPRCVRVIPCKDNILYIYVVSESKETIESARSAAVEMFPDCAFKVVDLLQRRMDKLLIRLPREQKNRGEELSELAREIEKNLPIFENLQNVTAVEPAYKVVDFEEKNEVCVRIYVLGKGKIPLNETDFSELKKLKDYPYDVVEGFFLPSRSNISTTFPLRGGVSIGVKGIKEAGTLGGFVTDEKGQHYILSCEHVLNPKGESCPSRVGRIVQPSESDKYQQQEKANKDLAAAKAKLYAQKEKELAYHGEEDKLERIRRYNSRIENEIEELQTKLGSLSVREIGNYVCGVKENVMLGANKVYVDAALAKLDENEGLEIECNGEINETVEESNQIFGFGSDAKTSNRIIDLENIINDRDTIDEEYPRHFSKYGRSTGLTIKGQLQTRHFFVNLDGYQPAGALQSYPHKYHCKNCSPNHDETNEMHNQVRGKRCEGCGIELSHGNNFTLWAYNCLSFRQPLRPFAEEGDSGSIVFNNNGCACALIFGVFNTQEALIALATPLQHIVEAFEKTNGIKIKLW